jgi:hypothetical protein
MEYDIANETDEARERRLMVEARTRRLGTFSHPWLTPTMSVETVRVEVTVEEDGIERCGFYLINVPSLTPTGDEDRDLAWHPATLASNYVTEHMPEAQIDETYPA